MKIRILSDIHLEFWNWKYKSCGEDAVFIAGDICPRSTHHGKPMFDLFRQIKVPVFFCLGNHDFYGDSISETIQKINIELSYVDLQHVHFLHNTYVDFDGYRICGSSLFTDFCAYGKASQPEVEIESKLGISDFRYIKDLKTEDYIKYSDTAKSFLKNQIEESALPLIFLTHWVPSMRFVDEKYRGNILNGYFVNECQEMFCDKIKLWNFAHTHSYLQQIIGDTKFICNPRGYPSENKSWIENLIIEI